MSRLTLYCDYVCPYVYRATEWVVQLHSLLDSPPEFDWRFFSLVQVNRRSRDGWTVWDQPSQDVNWETQDYARSLRLFWAAIAASRQGNERFMLFHLSLLRAIHAEREVTFDDTAVESMVDIARGCDLDVDRYRKDLRDPTCLERLQEDHASGVELNVFGTPTFSVHGAKPLYLKLSRVLDQQECLECWDSVSTTIIRRPYILEMKRPH